MRLTFQGNDIEIGDTVTYTAGLYGQSRTITVESIDYDNLARCVVFDGAMEDGSMVWGREDQIVAHKRQA